MNEAERTFSPAMVGGLIVAGIVAFAGFLLLLAYGGALGSGRDGRAHALSNSAVGYAALVELSRATIGGETVRDVAWLDTEDLVVVAIEPQTESEALAAVLETRGPKPTLLLLPKWSTQPHPVRPGWVRTVGDAHAPMFEDVLPEFSIGVADIPSGAIARGEGLLDGIAAPVPDRVRTISGEGVEPMLTLPGGEAVIARIASEVYVAADPDLFNNHGLKDVGSARAAIRILEALNSTGAEAVWFDLTVNGFARNTGPNLLRLAFEPPFVVMTLALLAAALLAGLHGAARFGAARAAARPIAFGKAALVDNGAGLIEQAGREAAFAGHYARLVRRQAARAGGAPPDLQSEALDAYLDRFTPPGAPSFSELAARLHLVRDRDDLVAAARALHRWKKEIVR